TLSAFSECRSILRCRVSVPCNSRNALNGAKLAPVSRSPCTRALMMKASGPNALVYDTPWYDGSGSTKSLKRPDAAHSNLPPSTMIPPIDVPCPPMYLVAELMMMSAPQSIGRHSDGVAHV